MSMNKRIKLHLVIKVLKFSKNYVDGLKRTLYDIKKDKYTKW